MQHAQHIQTSQYAFLPSKQDASVAIFWLRCRVACLTDVEIQGFACLRCVASLVVCLGTATQGQFYWNKVLGGILIGTIALNPINPKPGVRSGLLGLLRY